MDLCSQVFSQKNMSLSAGEWLGGECTIYILNQKDPSKWAGQGTAQEEEWGMWWKHINLSSSNLDVKISWHPLRGLDLLFPILFHEKLQIPEVDWKLQPIFYYHTLSQILVGPLHCESLCKLVCPWVICGPGSQPRDAQVIQKPVTHHRKNLSINPSDPWHLEQ